MWTSRSVARIRLLYSVRTKSDNVASQNVCLNLVRSNDKENFLCTLLLRNPQRRSALAVRAFNVEVAKVSEKVAAGNVGVLPLKFWENTVNTLYRGGANGSNVPEHPVIRELQRAINDHKLSKMHFQRLISARANANLNFLTVKQLEDYAEQSVSSVLYLLLEVHGVRNVHCDHAASHLGKAQGIVNLLRSIPHQTRRNAVPIPQEVLIAHGVNQERMVRNRADDKGVEEVTFALASVAHRHLETAQGLLKTVPRAVKPIFLPSIVIERFLHRLRLRNFHLTDPNVMRTDSLLPLVLYWRTFWGKY
ncbi:NADH dehydrogenase (ubiquinone) complex I, assembly factor 6 homolog [Anopheles ziemanni]|uniref:NADH dehydrogenase (ubiquinone) complex I, assembly factor 6 homolog n=1 Tax=Anopheles coustani TaxID=139045 RepID=UPI0026596BFB|nr:NADH dehydrogenase (ubiquinone) complex I, assembly factor 6 homolog [Anopheles coustani]XP_058176060.1 NADH dehydrogenase (ubiquinone) complex I, assembly factor 6 homolog [Anopheles ziemanni]